MSVVRFSSLGVLAAPIVSGCSSDLTTPGNDSGADVGTTTDAAATTDALADMSPTDWEAFGGETGPKDSPACIPVDASVETIPLGTQWACYQAACASQLTACAADCI